MPKLLKIAIVIIIIALLLFSQKLRSSYMGINPLFENHPHNKDPPIS